MKSNTTAIIGALTDSASEVLQRAGQVVQVATSGVSLPDILSDVASNCQAATTQAVCVARQATTFYCDSYKEETKVVTIQCQSANNGTDLLECINSVISGHADCYPSDSNPTGGIVAIGASILVLLALAYLVYRHRNNERNEARTRLINNTDVELGQYGATPGLQH